MFRHVLCPTDGSILSDEAVEKAISFAREIGSRITFFFAQSDPDVSLYGESELSRALDPDAYAARCDAQAESILSRAVTAAVARGVPCEAISRTASEPFEAIIAAAEENSCDVIVMASHGRRGIKGLLLGSQTQKVLVHSKFPVLVYR